MSLRKGVREALLALCEGIGVDDCECGEIRVSLNRVRLHVAVAEQLGVSTRGF